MRKSRIAPLFSLATHTLCLACLAQSQSTAVTAAPPATAVTATSASSPSAAEPAASPAPGASASLAPASAAAGIFPLLQVHRGLHGVAYTVFEGTQPEAMQVEILGVLHNALGPHQDMILARLQGTKPEYTGVVAGMSGSPVYIDGKLLGALSYRIGQFSKEPIAGITPIAEMLDVSEQAVSNGAYELQARRSVPAQPSDSAATATSSAPEIQPIETPLTFSGFSSEAVRAFGDRFRAIGLTPVSGLGGSSLGNSSLGNSSETAAEAGSGADLGGGPLVPGSAVSAMLVRGDLEISATCTVTYVDPHQVLACGHPITQFGRISMPMAKAEVVATLPSPLNAFKIVNTGATVGSFTDDRAAAIRGVLGETARMIPMSIHVHGPDAETSKDRTLHLEVVDNPEITPQALMVSLYQSLMQTNRYGADLSYVLRGKVAVTGYPALQVESTVAPTDQLPSAISAALTLGQRFMRIYDNSARLRSVERIDLDVDVLPGRRSMQIETAQASQPTAHAGDTITLEAVLRPYHGEARNVRIPVTLPQTLSAGPMRILLSDGATLDRLTSSNPGVTSPADLSSEIRQLNAAHSNDRMYVTLLLPEAQAVVDGHTLTAIPISMANVLEPLRTNREISLSGESAVPVASIPVDAMLTGEQVVSLLVE